MPLQSVSTGLDGSDIDTGIRTDLIESKDSATEEDVLVPPIGGEQADGTCVALPVSGTLDISDEDTQQLSVTLTDEQARSLSISKEKPVYLSANPAIATVDIYGLVTPIGGGGPINVSATILGSSDNYAVTVQA